MFALMIGIALAQAEPSHPCVGDFIFRATGEDVSVGVRIRKDPDVAEISFSDYGHVGSTDLRWEESSITIVDPTDKSNLVVVCSEKSATLVLPKGEYSPARSIVLKRSSGGLWEVGTREGWLKAED